MGRLIESAGPQLQVLIAEFQRVRGALTEAANAVPFEQRSTAFVGTWDVTDVVAHTIGWDYTNIEALPDFRDGRVPAFFGRYDSDWAAINADLVQRYRDEDWEALMASLARSGEAFVAAMAALVDEGLDNVALWGERRVTLRGMMRAVSRDEMEHVEQIRAFVEGAS